MDTRVPQWVRLGLVVLLAAPQLAIGIWAMVATENWFGSFPGFGPDLIAGEPPYNRHLASDVGSAFFATGVGLVLAAHWGTRRVVQLALVVFVAFTAPHVVYHVTNPAPGLSGAADVANALMLASGLVWAGLLWWGSTKPDQRNAPNSSVTEAAAAR